jgi:hypothetical protein
LDPLLGQPEPLVLAPQVDQPGREPGQRPAQEPVEQRTEERIEAPFDVEQKQREAVDRIQERAAGVGRRETKAGPAPRRLSLAFAQSPFSSTPR